MFTLQTWEWFQSFHPTFRMWGNLFWKSFKHLVLFLILNWCQYWYNLVLYVLACAHVRTYLPTYIHKPGFNVSLPVSGRGDEVYAAVNSGVRNPFLPVDIYLLLQVCFVLVINELHDGLPAIQWQGWIEGMMREEWKTKTDTYKRKTGKEEATHKYEEEGRGRENIERHDKKRTYRTPGKVRKNRVTI